MGFLYVVVLVIFLLLFKPFVNELRTVYQIVQSFFAPKINFKEKFGPWAIVTGCTDGIGKSISFELAKRGLNIVLISRSSSKLEKVATEIESTTTAKTKVIVADFSKGRVVYKHIEEELKDLDIGILVNNVGIQYSYPMYFGELPEDELWSLININIGAATQMTRLILPNMVSKKRGAIVNLSSGSKLQPLPFMNLYAASKIFVDYFSEGLRHEYRNSGITIQNLCPYFVSTKINHFSDRLRRVNIFTPDTDTYVCHALDSLGIIDNTTGYWPHRFQYCFSIMVPIWLRTLIGGLLYKQLRREYLKKSTKTIS